MGILKDQIKQLRRNQTEAEQIMWQAVRQFRTRGYAFRRQHPVCKVQVNEYFHYYIADFICLKAKLVIEIDGPIHDTQKEADLIRQIVIENHGYYVLRYSNDEVMHDLKRILEEIEFVALERMHS